MKSHRLRPGSHCVSLSRSEPELDALAYLRFASVYQAFDSAGDFEAVHTLWVPSRPEQERERNEHEDA